MGQHRADVRLGLSVLGEGVAGVIVVLIAVLHGQLFTVPAPWRRTAAVGQGYQLAAYCPHWATHMHVQGCDAGGHGIESFGCNLNISSVFATDFHVRCTLNIWIPDKYPTYLFITTSLFNVEGFPYMVFYFSPCAGL